MWVLQSPLPVLPRPTCSLNHPLTCITFSTRLLGQLSGHARVQIAPWASTPASPFCTYGVNRDACKTPGLCLAHAFSPCCPWPGLLPAPTKAAWLPQPREPPLLGLHWTKPSADSWGLQYRHTPVPHRWSFPPSGGRMLAGRDLWGNTQTSLPDPAVKSFQMRANLKMNSLFLSIFRQRRHSCGQALVFIFSETKTDPLI